MLGPVTLVGCTLVDNGGMPVGDPTGTTLVTNTFVWDSMGLRAWLLGATVSYSLILGGAPGAGNIDLDPVFRDPLAGDYRLHPTSPAIAAGLPTPEGDRAALLR